MDPINTSRPMEVALWAMKLHADEAFGPDPQSVKDQKWMHIDAACDIAVKVLSYFASKFEGAQVYDPTSELEELKMLFLSMDSVDKKAIIGFLRRKVAGDYDKEPPKN